MLKHAGLRMALQSLLISFRDGMVDEADADTTLWLTTTQESHKDSLICLLAQNRLYVMNPADENDPDKVCDVQTLTPQWTVDLCPSETEAVTYKVYCHGNAGIISTPGHMLMRAIGLTARQLKVQTAINTLNTSLDETSTRLSELTLTNNDIPSWQDCFHSAARGIEQAFPEAAFMVVGYDVLAWREAGRNQKPPDLSVEWQGQPTVGPEQTQKIAQRIVSEAIAGYEQAGCEARHVNRFQVNLGNSLADTPGTDVAVCAVSFLHNPKQVNAKNGLPLFLVAHITNGTLPQLTEDEWIAIDALLARMQKICVLRDRLSFKEAAEDLDKQLSRATNQRGAAIAVATFLDKMFAATEVAVLERQGNFLSVIVDSRVPTGDLPVFYIPDGKPGLITLLTNRWCNAEAPIESVYTPNVLKSPDYLPVLETTRTQLTIPLVWQNELVGAMLIGCGALDAFTPDDQDMIAATGARFADAIAFLRQSAEVRAILHMLKDYLPAIYMDIKNACDSFVKSDNLSEPLDRQRLLDRDHKFRRVLLEDVGAKLTTMSRFIDEYSRIDAASDQDISVDPCSLIREIWQEETGLDLARSEFRAEHGHDPQLEFATPDACTEIRVRTKLTCLRLALAHILQNAIRSMLHMQGSSKVIISINTTDEVQGTHAFLKIRIEDEGKGITEQEEKHIDTIFNKTDISPSHLGGGLNIAKRAMASFGGRIEYKPNVDIGSTFTLFVPKV